MVVNSHPLYRLSYWGMKNNSFNINSLFGQYFIASIIAYVSNQRFEIQEFSRRNYLKVVDLPGSRSPFVVFSKCDAGR
jgi:hypothetical protein